MDAVSLQVSTVVADPIAAKNHSTRPIGRVLLPTEIEDEVYVEFRFRDKEWTLFKRLIGGKRQNAFSIKIGNVLRSLSTSSKGLAIERAKKLIAAVQEKRWNDLERTKAKRSMATIDEIIKAFEEKAQQYNENLRAETRRGYVNALLRVLRYATGEEDTERLRKLRADVLTEKLVDDFRTQYLADTAQDLLAKESARRGGRAVIVNARAMFAPRAMKCYRALELPDLKEFLQAANFTAKPRDVIPISSAEMQRIGEASLELKRGNPALYLVHLCFRHLGMRNKEIEAARVEWIDRKADGSGAMAIVQRTYFDPKQSQGRVPISADVLAEMDEALAAARKEDEPAPEQGSNLVDFLVPAKTKTERWELINVHHSAWMRRFLPDHPKSSYELRRWASMVVRRRQGSDAQEQFLRHKAKTVAGIHYSYEIEVQPVTLADCGL